MPEYRTLGVKVSIYRWKPQSNSFSSKVQAISAQDDGVVKHLEEEYFDNQEGVDFLSSSNYPFYLVNAGKESQDYKPPILNEASSQLAVCNKQKNPHMEKSRSQKSSKFVSSPTPVPMFGHLDTGSECKIHVSSGGKRISSVVSTSKGVGLLNDPNIFLQKPKFPTDKIGIKLEFTDRSPFKSLSQNDSLDTRMYIFVDGQFNQSKNYHEKIEQDLAVDAVWHPYTGYHVESSDRKYWVIQPLEETSSNSDTNQKRLCFERRWAQTNELLVGEADKWGRSGKYDTFRSNMGEYLESLSRKTFPSCQSSLLHGEDIKIIDIVVAMGKSLGTEVENHISAKPHLNNSKITFNGFGECPSIMEKPRDRLLDHNIADPQNGMSPKRIKLSLLDRNLTKSRQRYESTSSLHEISQLVIDQVDTGPLNLYLNSSKKVKTAPEISIHLDSGVSTRSTDSRNIFKSNFQTLQKLLQSSTQHSQGASMQAPSESIQTTGSFNEELICSNTFSPMQCKNYCLLNLEYKSEGSMAESEETYMKENLVSTLHNRKNNQSNAGLNYPIHLQPGNESHIKDLEFSEISTNPDSTQKSNLSQSFSRSLKVNDWEPSKNLTIQGIRIGVHEKYNQTGVGENSVSENKVTLIPCNYLNEHEAVTKKQSSSPKHPKLRLNNWKTGALISSGQSPAESGAQGFMGRKLRSTTRIKSQKSKAITPVRMKASLEKTSITCGEEKSEEYNNALAKKVIMSSESKSSVPPDILTPDVQISDILTPYVNYNSTALKSNNIVTPKKIPETPVTRRPKRNGKQLSTPLTTPLKSVNPSGHAAVNKCSPKSSKKSSKRKRSATLASESGNKCNSFHSELHAVDVLHDNNGFTNGKDQTDKNKDRVWNGNSGHILADGCREREGGFQIVDILMGVRYVLGDRAADPVQVSKLWKGKN